VLTAVTAASLAGVAGPSPAVGGSSMPTSAPALRRSAALLAALALVVGLVLAAPGERAHAEAQGPPHHADTLLVSFAPGTAASSRAAAHAAQGARVENRMEWLDLDVVRLRSGDSPAAAAARYTRNPNVAYAHPNWEVRLLSTPNDTLFRDLWGLHNTGQAVTGSLVRGVADADIDGPEGWSAAFGTGSFPSSGGVRVGVLDTGIDQAHVDLLGKTKACASALSGLGLVTSGSCADDNLHGTHVAGTIGAIANNGIGVAGAAPNAELAVFKALNSAGSGFYADVIAGIRWLRTTGGARIVSMSLGGPQDKSLDSELSNAYASGTLLIAAAGNDGDSTPNYPAYHRDVVSVAATDAADKRAYFSNCNADVEIAAPGVDIWSTAPGNSYVAISGTSMATPHVSGVAAMVMWKLGLDHAKTRSQLNSTAVDLGANGRDTCFGFGRVNLAAALGSGGGGTPTEPTPTEPGAIAGAVTAVKGKSAISGATVDCGSAGRATTGADGSYLLGSVPVGSYTCTASAAGYRSKSSTVSVSSGTTTTANFQLN
jgi:thermitase